MPLLAHLDHVPTPEPVAVARKCCGLAWSTPKGWWESILPNIVAATQQEGVAGTLGRNPDVYCTTQGRSGVDRLIDLMA